MGWDLDEACEPLGTYNLRRLGSQGCAGAGFALHDLIVSLLKLYVPHASFASPTPNLDKQPEANQRSYKQKRCLLKRHFRVTHRITKKAGEISLEAVQ